MKVKLSHSPNPDIRGGYWTDPIDSGRQTWVEVSGFPEASKVCRDYIEKNGLGGGNWTGGQVKDSGAHVARVSYNGRVWGIDGKEIT